MYISDIVAWCAISFGSLHGNPVYYARYLYLNGELITDLTIPDSVTSIGSYVFYGCSSLSSVTIGFQDDKLSFIESNYNDSVSIVVNYDANDKITKIDILSEPLVVDFSYVFTSTRTDPILY